VKGFHFYKREQVHDMELKPSIVYDISRHCTFWAIEAFCSDGFFNRFLHDQLASVFSILDSPVWMDSSTTTYCRHIEVISLIICILQFTKLKGHYHIKVHQITWLVTLASNKDG
jgi:hypothetical protein